LGDRYNLLRKEKEIAQMNLIENQKQALDTQTKMTNAFARFVPKEFLTFLNKKSIVEVELGNQIQKQMTVLFSDIRSFTSLSEKMSPQENFNFLNSYLKRIGPIIRANGGFIDKYIGDAVMALFPDSPAHAIDTALLMQNTIIEYNNHRKAIGYDEIAIGIGIHSGNLMLGTIGEENRMEGTVISDDVNLASRIESLTKYYGAEILISGKLFNQLPDKTKYQYRIIDTVIVKGRSEPVTLIEILDQKTTKYYNMKIKTKSKLVEAIKLYREKSITESLNIFKELSTESQGNDYVHKIYIERCNRLLTEGIPENFTGVEKLENK
nr:adenylate/guanylate cyclase domain-containing protein [Clostridia bacterium]